MTWEAGSESDAKVVICGSEVVAERRLSKRPLKVVVYTPLVTEPAFPVILAFIEVVEIA